VETVGNHSLRIWSGSPHPNASRLVEWSRLPRVCWRAIRGFGQAESHARRDVPATAACQSSPARGNLEAELSVDWHVARIDYRTNPGAGPTASRPPSEVARTWDRRRGTAGADQAARGAGQREGPS